MGPNKLHGILSFGLGHIINGGQLSINIYQIGKDYLLIN